ncbi:DUF72 domain-containing protein [Oxyplasma meridianum]|uniref:DUF72 domain-containing protein n=1 Tax=Oxyplasma meridianum TaxID=3073602 RepID=A0AAX4NH43_9ARCH
MKIRTGCSGWSYSSWVGPFYPKGSSSNDFLKLYSRVFHAVEIDSTFYRVPEKVTVIKWRDSTPDNFLFSPKFPGEITHKNGLNVDHNKIADFLYPIEFLGNKLGPVLVQLPAAATYSKNFCALRNFIKMLPESIRFAIEFRDNSWFREDVFMELEKNRIAMVWSDIPMAKVPTIITSDFIYLRLVGDRSIDSHDFGKLRIDRYESILKWAEELKSKENEIENSFIFANNHYQGFSPATVNIFRKAMGMEEVEWATLLKTSLPDNQKRLF